MARMEGASEMIDYLEVLARRIKNIYHADKTWDECHKSVEGKLTELKAKVRNGQSELEIVKLLHKYTDLEILEALGNDFYL